MRWSMAMVCRALSLGEVHDIWLTENLLFRM
jgi:hypothetical protein